jgi:hypothetical protein
METFFDPKTKKPVEQIEVAQGATRILGLKKFHSNDVAVRTQEFKVAFCDKVIRLKDKTKLSYDKRTDQHEVAADSEPVESNDSLYFQICGNGSGTTELTARFTNTPGSVSYSRPVTVTVTPNEKRLRLFPSVRFETLWANHPLNHANTALYHDPNHPCASKGLVGQCMIRFCVGLDRSGVSFHGFPGKKCYLKGQEHKHHFIDPNDFERWKGVKDAYVWETKPPFQLEPMPGIAAYYYTMSRRGVILFENYFPAGPKKKDMAGGHIDLWNRDQMGNTFGYANEGLAAFVRSRKIVFWPLE